MLHPPLPQVIEPKVKAFLYTWGAGRVTAEGEKIQGEPVGPGGQPAGQTQGAVLTVCRRVYWASLSRITLPSSVGFCCAAVLCSPTPQLHC